MATSERVPSALLPGVVLIAAAVGALLVIAGIDWQILGRSPIAEGRPRLEPIYFLRSALAALSALAAVAGVAWLRGPSPARLEFMPWERPTFWATLALSLALAMLLAVSPEAFHSMGSEDGAVENLSAALYFACCAGFVGIAVRWLRSDRHGALETLGAAGLAGVFFLIGMEEVSWFQRVLDIETPTALATNTQGEMNLHNFATDLVETLYYGCAFLFLVGLSYALDAPGLTLLQKLPALERLRPRVGALLVAAPMVAFNYDMWDIGPTQFAFYATGLIALDYWRRCDAPPDRRALFALAAVLGVTQLIFLKAGDTQLRSWDVTEFKELLIPLAFAVYTLDVWRRSSAASATAA